MTRYKWFVDIFMSSRTTVSVPFGETTEDEPPNEVEVLLSTLDHALMRDYLKVDIYTGDSYDHFITVAVRHIEGFTCRKEVLS